METTILGDIRFDKLADINKVFELINKSYTYNK